MARDGAKEGATASLEQAEPVDPALASEEEGENAEPSYFEDPKRLVQSGVIIVALVVAIYLLIPTLLDTEGAIHRLGNAHPVWVVIGFGFAIVMFVSYVGLFKGVVGDSRVRLNWSESYQITMAGLAATRLFSAGGAGGIVLTYWALRKAGMPKAQSGSRMVAFLIITYAVYMVTLLIGGILLRSGVLNGEAPVGLTIVPAAIAGGVIVAFLLISLIPGDLHRRLAESSPDTRLGRIGVRLAGVPATVASGTRMALDLIKRPSAGGLALVGAIGFWAANIGILWASFEAFDLGVPGAVIAQGFFVGMVANLIPLPGGVGGVDAGMIGTFVAFGYGLGPVTAAVLMYRLFAFWLPLLPGVVAFFQLRRTVLRWEDERPQHASAAATASSERTPPGANTSQSEVRSTQAL